MIRRPGLAAAALAAAAFLQAGCAGTQPKHVPVDPGGAPEGVPAGLPGGVPGGETGRDPLLHPYPVG